MAYYNYSNYGTPFANQYYAPVQQMQQPQQNYTPTQPQQNSQMQPVQIQNGGFIPAPNEMYARNYPVAPGNSVTFKDESAPYVYTKTMGYNQLETPRFEKYRLVKEEDAPQTPVNAPTISSNDKTMDLSRYALKTELEALQAKIEGIEKKFEDAPEGKHMKKEVNNNADA